MKKLYPLQLAAGTIALAVAVSVSAQLGAPGMPGTRVDARVDTRKVIELPAAEQEHVMHEMQQFLVAIYGVMDASLRDDFKAAATAARASGRTEPTGIEKSIAPKLPPEFRKLAFDTHARFDQIAVEAEKGDRLQVLKRVSELLGSCVACHAGYAIRVK